MKGKTLDKTSFRMFSGFFINSSGSNLPWPVVGSGMPIPDIQLQARTFPHTYNAFGMVYHQFYNTHVGLHYCIGCFYPCPTCASLFMGGHSCPHSFRLLPDTRSPALTSANIQDVLIPHPWLAGLHHLSTPMEHVHISGTSSSFLPKGKNTQVKCALGGLSVSNIQNIKHIAICFRRLTPFLRPVIPFLWHHLDKGIWEGLQIPDAGCTPWEHPDLVV